jgi:hypothetical protein
MLWVPMRKVKALINARRHKVLLPIIRHRCQRLSTATFIGCDIFQARDGADAPSPNAEI